MRLEGEVVFITGGASGIGEAVVDRFISEGAKCVVLDQAKARLQKLKDTHKGKVECVEGDVRSLQANKLAVERGVQVFGKLDTLIVNAGIWDFSVSIQDLPEEKICPVFDEIMAVNVKGYLLAVKAALKHLQDSNGQIIFTLSNAAFYTDGGGPLYTASKHACLGLLKQLAYELAPNIRVNGVAPGGLASNLRGPRALSLHRKSVSEIQLEDILPALLPIGEAPTAADYTGAYVFFATRKDIVPVTGAVLNYDGGIGVRGFFKAAGSSDN